MIKLAYIANKYQAQLRQQFGCWIRPAHLKALMHIINCHTSQCGELLYYCRQCHLDVRYYPGCGDRHCPACQHAQNSARLAKQQLKLLPVDYYMPTFTLPHELNHWVWHHQKEAFDMLFMAAKSTLCDFFKRDKQLGEYSGFTGVIHTPSRQVTPHYHIHFIVPAGAFNHDKTLWKAKSGGYWFNEQHLAAVFRGKFISLLTDRGWKFPQTPKQWIAHCRYFGRGEQALTALSLSQHHQ